MTTRDLVLIGLFAAFIVVLGLMPSIPALIPGVPITLQSLGVMLAGALIGPKRGALACLVVIALVALGLPVLSGGRGGLGVFAGPTVGFLIGWVPAAAVTGYLAIALDPIGGNKVRRFAGIVVATIVGGIVVDYALGIGGLVLVSGVDATKALFGSLVFVPGDVIKAVVVSLVTVGVTESYRIERK